MFYKNTYTRKNASRCWYSQLDLLAETEEADTQRCLDTDDL